MKVKLFLILLIAAAFFAACDKENEGTTSLDSWAGSWRIEGELSPINVKASRGEISISPSSENTIIINGSLFGRASDVPISGTVSGNVVTFDYTDDRGKLYGDGTMRNVDNIDFHYTTDDNSDIFEYRVTAIRVN